MFRADEPLSLSLSDVDMVEHTRKRWVLEKVVSLCDDVEDASGYGNAYDQTKIKHAMNDKISILGLGLVMLTIEC